SAGERVKTGLVITSESGVVFESSPCPTTRTVKSRSVASPTTRPLFCTTTLPMLLLSIARAASSTGVFAFRATMRGLRYHLRDISKLLSFVQSIGVACGPRRGFDGLHASALHGSANSLLHPSESAADRGIKGCILRFENHTRKTA